MSRTVERLVHGKWVPVEFMDLKSGCTFRLFESDGTPVVDQKGKTEWIAASKPYIGKSGSPQINYYDSFK